MPDFLADLASPFSSALHSFAQVAAPIAVTALWQGIVLATALGICLKLAPRTSATHRFLIWSAGFLVVVALPLAPPLAHLSSTSAAINNSAAASPSPLLQLDLRWSLAIAALWLVASAVRAVDLLIHSLRLRRLWRSATPVDLPAMCIPSGRHFDVCTTSSISRPSVIGFFAPRILIPDWLFARLTPAELEHIVLHESEHLRRRDDWTNLLQKLALVVFPLSPALWFIDSRLSKQREMACDEGVVRITNAPRAYAACLASLAERGLAYRTEALSLGAWHHRSELVHRVHGILRNQRAMHPIAARALLATLGSGLLVASVSLARCPQLVAFVQTASAGPAVAHANTEPAALADAAYSSSRANTMPQFHAVEAVAKFPVEHAAPTVNRTPHSSTSSTPSRNQALQISALHSPAPAAAPAQPAEQWIVYTEFEQVETLNPANQNIADYDTTQSTSAAPMNQAPASPGDPTAKTQPASRITVTRLILKFTPSNSAQPAAIPIGNGWFVIQL